MALKSFTSHEMASSGRFLIIAYDTKSIPGEDLLFDFCIANFNSAVDIGAVRDGS